MFLQEIEEREKKEKAEKEKRAALAATEEKVKENIAKVRKASVKVEKKVPSDSP